MKHLLTAILAGTTFLFATAQSHAAAVSVGDLLIYRVGTGSGTLGDTATAVFIDEYTPLGTLVQSIALPTTGSSALTAVGNDPSEGMLSMLANGTVILTGYRATVGSANPSAADPSVVNRVIGTIALAGVANTSFALTDTPGTIRSATSTDGSSLFYVGTSAGLSYVASPSGASTSTLIDSRSTRQALLGGNTLYASGTSGNAVKIESYGNLPTGPTTGTPVVAALVTDTMNGFVLLHLNSSVAGPNTLYTVGQNKVYKYPSDGTSWSANGTITATGASGITGTTPDGATVHLWVTSGTTLYSEIDTSGYGANINGSLTSLATAPANEAFRGIAAIPVTVGYGYVNNPSQEPSFTVIIPLPAGMNPGWHQYDVYEWNPNVHRGTPEGSGQYHVVDIAADGTMNSNPTMPWAGQFG